MIILITDDISWVGWTLDREQLECQYVIMCDVRDLYEIRWYFLCISCSLNIPRSFICCKLSCYITVFIGVLLGAVVSLRARHLVLKHVLSWIDLYERLVCFQMDNRVLISLYCSSGKVLLVNECYRNVDSLIWHFY